MTDGAAANAHFCVAVGLSGARALCALVSVFVEYFVRYHPRKLACDGWHLELGDSEVGQAES